MSINKTCSLIEIQNYWYLLSAALIAGQIGNFLNLKMFRTSILALLTAFHVIFVAVRIGIGLSRIL